ncbi:hypothetical protein EYF80_035394 [Liparis tanakae]|uniref:Uncharacterized protein n=1 Tax=Liparis tanakae TaxID=230148 RepID=A0A4Z2GLK9_9TELE|nr:hypothetical protein EYF80_035394 [Liparis tanakae]
MSLTMVERAAVTVSSYGVKLTLESAPLQSEVERVIRVAATSQTGYMEISSEEPAVVWRQRKT